MRVFDYERDRCVNYAKKYALTRNSNYYNFDKIGGDCTNFVSQCVYNGALLMNYTKITGWYYININNRSPAWTSVEYFYKFITTNKGVGPFGFVTDKEQIEIGDVIQLGNEQIFYHSLIVSQINDSNIYVCSHTYDALNRPLSSYFYKQIRYIHIDGVRM